MASLISLFSQVRPNPRPRFLDQKESVWIPREQTLSFPTVSNSPFNENRINILCQLSSIVRVIFGGLVCIINLQQTISLFDIYSQSIPCNKTYLKTIFGDIASEMGFAVTKIKTNSVKIEFRLTRVLFGVMEQYTNTDCH